MTTIVTCLTMNQNWQLASDVVYLPLWAFSPLAEALTQLKNCCL